jgi:uncharacterized protein YqjF (DUF2071 family)
MPAQAESSHRPWPVPPSPWVMKQKWHDLLFMHWPVHPGEIRSLIPTALELETYDGSAWVGVVPFRMSGVRLRWTPGIPGLSSFPELNVRTYVTAGGKPGVWFFSLEAANTLAVSVARGWFHLPYFRARMSCSRRGDTIEYESRRFHPGAPEAEFRGSYRSAGPMFGAQPGSVEHFLTERYCLYAESRGRIFRGEIDHRPWNLQAASAEIGLNTVAASHGIRLPDTKPLLHFAQLQDVKIWPIRSAKEQGTSQSG